ncbi:L-alanine-DL-glutamate epimerase-like enolase superfamily enzyme [Natranaerovirga pectinivora]|uniref:L-alanine-DL-glutamate epimerase-like enolase superfamily enzyme n=1 Tax=Natranaerovirga pectinivora TaxID=682400 RepID=A0A4R3MS30_9FIRM|nr:enolase C-terminal domain-like protein [Natranaerovirga pectinivora]TCT16228.1 L-alanine-DL-glutamate epimerase-like enolase superfamily enzyme [Natranaerovirga pectinivora]
MFAFDFKDEIRFTKAIYYNFNPIPLPRPFKDGTGGMGKNAPEQGCIELYDDEGACAHLSVGRGFVKNILPMILNGEKKSYNEWRTSLYWKIRNSGFQSEKAVEVGMLDLMMLDILSQRAGKPLHRFLGATKDWAAAYKGGGSILLEDDELIEDMTRYVEEGYNTLKFKVGSDDMDRDLRRVEKVRKAVGDHINISVDANQKWDVETAYKFSELVKPYNLAWIEEPIHANDMNGIKRLKEMGFSAPIAFGESMRISYEYEIYIEKGVDHVQPSLGRMTRIDDLIRIRDMARQNNVKFSSGGRIYLNAIFGCLYNEDEYIEYHEPISKPVGEYTIYQPEEKNGRFYCPSDVIGNPQRMNIEKLEKDGLIESKQFFYMDK